MLFDMFVTYVYLYIIYIYLFYVFLMYDIYPRCTLCTYMRWKWVEDQSGNHHIYKQASFPASSTGSSSSSFKKKNGPWPQPPSRPQSTTERLWAEHFASSGVCWSFWGAMLWLEKNPQGKPWENPHQHHCSRESNCHWALGIEGWHVEQVQQNFDDNQNLPLKKSSAKGDREFGRRSSFNVPSTHS